MSNLWRFIAIGVGVLIILVSTVFAVTRNVDSRILVKLRNSLAFDVVDPQSVDWRPVEVPGIFKWETRDAPSQFVDIANTVTGEMEHNNFEIALNIAKHLVSHASRSGAPIQSTLAATYNTIVTDGHGYCSDYTAVFTGLSLAAGVPVREWGMSFDGFGGDGHAFNEIYAPEQNKWIFIDPFYSFFITDRNGTPVSVVELRKALRGGRANSLQVHWIDSNSLLLPSKEYALEYYQRGINQVFLIGANNLFTYESHNVIRIAGKLSRSAEQLAALSFGLQPDILILEADENKNAIKELFRMKVSLLVLMWLVVLVAIIAVTLKVRRHHSLNKKPESGNE